MQRNVKYVVFFEIALILLLIPFSLMTSVAGYELNTVKSSLGDEQYYIEGTASYTVIVEENDKPASNYLGVYINLEYNYTKELTTTFIDKNTMIFEKNYDYNIILINQIQDGTTFMPTSVALKFYDETDVYLGTAPGLSFTTICHVNLETGQRSYCNNPFDAYYVRFVATFPSPSTNDIYEEIWTSLWLGDDTDIDELIWPEARTWVINDEPYYEYMVTQYYNRDGLELVELARQVFHGEGLYAFAEVYRFVRDTGFFDSVVEYLEADDWFWLFFCVSNNLTNILDDGNPEITGPAQIDVENADTITLQYTAEDIHFDHYNFYNNDTELLGTNTTWQPIFSFEVQPEEGNNYYIFVVVDSLGNTSQFITTIIYTKKVSGFTLVVIIVVLTSLSSLRHKKKNEK